MFEIPWMWWHPETLRDSCKILVKHTVLIQRWHNLLLSKFIGENRKEQIVGILVPYIQNSNILHWLIKRHFHLINDNLVSMGKVTHFNDHDIKTCLICKYKINPTHTQRYLESVASFVLVSGFKLNTILKIHLVTFIIHTL